MEVCSTGEEESPKCVGVECKLEISEEESGNIIEVIASTGKFWHDWDKLKSFLSFKLKQVLSEYDEAKMSAEQQITSLQETFSDLEKRLDEALLNFDEGPPFTLQRLCEILLAARSIYPNLSKLALALEKNLLVTSMLAISTDPYPQLEEVKPPEDKPENTNEDSQTLSNSLQNGVELMEGDADEVATQVEESTNRNDDMNIDTEFLENIVSPSEEANAKPNENS